MWLPCANSSLILGHSVVSWRALASPVISLVLACGAFIQGLYGSTIDMVARWISLLEERLKHREVRESQKEAGLWSQCKTTRNISSRGRHNEFGQGMEYFLEEADMSYVFWESCLRGKSFLGTDGLSCFSEFLQSTSRFKDFSWLLWQRVRKSPGCIFCAGSSLTSIWVAKEASRRDRMSKEGPGKGTAALPPQWITLGSMGIWWQL